MSVDADGERTGEMTLAFELAAIEQFADPERVLDDAREWSRYVGVVANDTDAVRAFVAERDLEQDFELGDRDIWLIMEGIREASDAPRHVFVGTTPEDRRIADATGWEYRTPTEVADAAGWSLGDSDGDSADPGLFARLWARITE
ncbi:hypothetical protein C475_10784 [Halosimplex carlsbadense 2-9-1]|uniref:DUF7124 domain-containing protein n=1 Tax=Halosimplex carlsbadense 2-9-1 TaxID=797114 RepID=M0CP82_9EURY|nr:hypothetical protein [Halosimplex carlsbadense]ELZ25026.1 hypothetical protein C475_10784 [Halosimplex carlsbadense 2-9-1]